MRLKITIVISLFLLVFGFQIFGINTRYYIYLLIIILLVIRPTNIKSTIHNRRILLFLLGTFLYSIFGVIITCIHGYFDISFAIQAFGVFILQTFTLLYCLLFFNKKTFPAEKYIIIVFVLQSLIIFCGFLFPTFLDTIREFQYNEIQERADRYLSANIFRGLSLSGDLFFGLSASFGLAMIFCTDYAITHKSFWAIVALLIILVASFFVGRTSLIGLFFSFILILLEGRGYKFKLLSKILLIVLVSFFLLILILPKDTMETLQNSVLPFALEMFYNLQDSNELSSSSTNDLISMLGEEIGTSSFILGDGLFSQGEGYYKNVDVGYYRQIFFGGIPLVIYSVLFLLFVLFPISYRKNKIKLTRIPKRYIILSSIILCYVLVLHIKGLTIIHCREIWILISIYFYSLYLNEKNRVYNTKIIS